MGPKRDTYGAAKQMYPPYSVQSQRNANFANVSKLYYFIKFPAYKESPIRLWL